MSWNDERVELLKKLWTDGLSASQIAAELGSVTRNAVIGKVHRLGLSGRAKTPGSTAVRPRKTAQPAPPPPAVQRPAARSVSMPQVRGNVALKPMMMAEPFQMAHVQPEAEVVVPMSRRVKIMELREAMCKWPIGDPTQEDFVFCGADCGFGTPYCTYHSSVAYQPAGERRRAR